MNLEYLGIAEIVLLLIIFGANSQTKKILFGVFRAHTEILPDVYKNGISAGLIAMIFNGFAMNLWGFITSVLLWAICAFMHYWQKRSEYDVCA